MATLRDLTRLVQFVRRFENPIAAVRFRMGRFAKGEPVRLVLRSGQEINVARTGDYWIIDRILKGVPVEVDRERQWIIVDGARLRQGTSDTFVYREIFLSQDYGKVLGLIPAGGVLVDAGAHVGLFSLYAGSHFSKIIAVEADPENCRLAQMNVASLDGRCVVVNRALWSSDGASINFADGGQQSGEGKVVVGDPSGGVQAVETITLPSLLDSHGVSRCTLLKMDIEGAEYAAIGTLPEADLQRIDALCLEYHPDLGGRMKKDELVGRLRGAGFSVEETVISSETGLLIAHRPAEKPARPN